MPGRTQGPLGLSGHGPLSSASGTTARTHAWRPGPIGGVGAGSAPTDPCAPALKTAGQDGAAVTRALDQWHVIDSAARAHGIDPALLAAIGVRETGFRNVWQSGGGRGAGVFQIDLSRNPAVTAAQAFDISFAANYAARMLASNEGAIRAKYPKFSTAQLLQATAASYNFGVRNISGNPKTIDVGTTRDNYGSNVMGLMQCFKRLRRSHGGAGPPG